jgi:hypothetical protein
MRNTWDRARWLDMQSMIARIFGKIADLPMTARDDEVRVHCAHKKKAPVFGIGGFGRGPRGDGAWGRGPRIG